MKARAQGPEVRAATGKKSACQSRSRTTRVASGVVSLAIPALLALGTAEAQEWRYYGGDPGGTRFSPLTQISRENVRRLKRVWTYHTGEADRGGNSTINPDREKNLFNSRPPPRT